MTQSKEKDRSKTIKKVENAITWTINHQNQVLTHPKYAKLHFRLIPHVNSGRNLDFKAKIKDVILIFGFFDVFLPFGAFRSLFRFGGYFR